MFCLYYPSNTGKNSVLIFDIFIILHQLDILGDEAEPRYEENSELRLVGLMLYEVSNQTASPNFSYYVKIERQNILPVFLSRDYQPH